jgi:hypothetical protein
MYEKLQQKLAAIREELSAKKEVNLGKLESLKAETRQAFDEAIDRVSKRFDVRAELARRSRSLAHWRVGLFKTIFPVQLKYLFSMPFIYGMIIPAFFLHACLEIYHQVAFRLYGIPLVPARRYFVFDRGMLPYLNWLEKFHCFYCEYFNCLLQYAVEIAGRTERFWCPIKHAKRMDGAHSHYPKFVEYLDGEKYHEKAKGLRDFSDVPGSSDRAEKACDFVK